MEKLDPQLLAMLVCPVPACHATLRQEGDVLVCTGCGLRYPIEQRWPVMIPELARPARTGDESDGD